MISEKVKIRILLSFTIFTLIFSANSLRSFNVLGINAINLYALQAGQKARVSCNGPFSKISWLKRSNTESSFEVTCNAKPVGSPAPDPTPTPTPVPSPLPTPSTTPMPMPSPDPTSGLPVPLCPNHDSTKWHPLVLRNVDGSANCTYGHEHHDDPNKLNEVFGSVSVYTSGQEISYPWQTTSAAGEENHAKHEFYKWSVVSFKEMGSKCTPSNATLGLKNVRAQYHQDAVHGALVRFHSYWLEAQGCDPKDSNFAGIIRIGGHMDYGRLSLSDGTGEEHYLTLSGDPTGYSDDRRIHMGYVNGEVPCCMNTTFTWYGSNRYLNVLPGPKFSVRNGIFGEDWGALDSKSLVPVYKFKYWFGDYNTGGNNSSQEPVHLLSFDIPSELDSKDGKTDGYVTYKGFTNRYGDLLASACSPTGPDCVPISVEGMKVGHYEFRAGSNNVPEREYDVLVNGKSTIKYPN